MKVSLEEYRRSAKSGSNRRTELAHNGRHSGQVSSPSQQLGGPIAYRAPIPAPERPVGLDS